MPDERSGPTGTHPISGSLPVEVNTLIRSEGCPSCGARMLWTQNAWPTGNDLITAAAYRCDNGHLMDPDATRQCPVCGVHDTHLAERRQSERDVFRCNRCHHVFAR